MSEVMDAIDPEELRDAASRLLTDLVDRRAAYADAGRGDFTALSSAIAEQGWALLTVPAEMDGLGQSFAALGPIYEEMGRALSPLALAPSLAALELLRVDPTDALRDIAARVSVGEGRVAVAVAGNEVSVNGGNVTGELRNVLADPGTTALLLATQAGALIVDLEGAGVSTSEIEMWDRSRRLIDISLSGARATPATNGTVADAVARVRAHLDLALAWDSIGGARRSMDETIAYMMTRQQFGRPIGSFQALKHRAADLKVGIEVAAAAVRSATRAFADGEADAATVAAQARLIANEAYRAMAEDSVQLHGGIGFTWEHDCHLFLKRALLNEVLYETPDERRDRIAPAIIDRALKDQA